MKKMILAVALLAGATFGVNAQEFAPKAGNLSTSVEFNPFNGADHKSFSIEALEGRYFFSDNEALVVELGLNIHNEKYVPSTEVSDNFNSQNYGRFAIALGYENHFKQYGRMDLFAGLKLGYARGFASSKTSAQAFYTDRNGTEMSYVRTTETTNYIDGDEQNGVEPRNAYNAIRFGVYTGFDFYIYKGLFCGATLALQLEDQLYVTKKLKTNAYNPETGYVATTTTESKIGGHNFDFGTLVHPQIRLGWTF